MNEIVTKTKEFVEVIEQWIAKESSVAESVSGHVLLLKEPPAETRD